MEVHATFRKSRRAHAEAVAKTKAEEAAAWW